MGTIIWLNRHTALAHRVGAAGLAQLRATAGQTHGRLAREVQAECGLSRADYGVLVHLTEVPEGRLRLLELAKAVEWEKSRMSHHINRMTKRGLVAREECADDARVAFVVVTSAGGEALAAAAPHHVERVRRLFIDPLSPAELAMFAQIANRILEGLEEDCV